MTDSPRGWGLCWMCDAPCFKPRVLVGAHRDTFELSGGTQVDLTFCADCHPKPGDLPALWERVVANDIAADQPENRAAAGASALSAVQQRLYDAHHQNLASQTLSGPIATRLWTEVSMNG